MEYFSTDDIRNSKKNYIAEILKDHVGRNLQDGFAADLVIRYANDIFDRQKNNLNILDCGVGNAEFAKQLNVRGLKNVYGLDVDNYLSEDNKNFIKDFKISDLNCEKIPWQDNFFDIITAWCVLPHLENPHFFIREALRVLRPGGLLIVSIPHILSKASLKYFKKNKDFPRYLSSTNHITVFTPGSFKNLTKGFDVVNMEYLVDPRIFKGFKGKIIKSLFGFSHKYGIFYDYIYRKWGYNQIWILSKQGLKPQAS